MMTQLVDFGPVTDTRTLESAVSQAIAKLRAAPECDRSRDLTRRALRYRDILASWEMVPPNPEEQTETVARVLRVIGAIMRHLAADDGTRGSDSDAPPDSDSEAPPDSDSDQELSMSVPSRTRQKSVGRIELVPSATSGGGKIDILFPFRRRWVPVPGLPGVATQSVHGTDGIGGHHVMVRMVGDAQLEEHRQEDVELIYILRGGISLGDDSLFAGAIVRLRDGATCPSIRALGDSELLLIGTSRPLICG